MFNSSITNHYTTFCSVQNLKKIRNFVEKSLLKSNINIRDTEMIVLAVDEVCSNSIIHSNSQNPNSFIDIFLKLKKGEVFVEIKDKGKEFDYNAYQEPSISQLIKEKAKGKMGLMMVRNIMDKMEYIHEKDLNIFRLVKKVEAGF